MNRTPSLWLLTAALGAAAALSGARIGAFGQPQINGISPEALAQIDALIREKDARTPAERKIDSQLLYAMRMARGIPIASGVPTQEVGVPYADDGHVIVDVKANATPSLLAHVNAITAEAKPFAGGMLQLHLDVDRIEDLASDPDVSFIQPKQGAMLASVSPRPAIARSAGTRAARANALIGRLREVLAHAQDTSARQPGWFAQAPGGDDRGPLVGTGLGNISAQGDVTHRAAVFRGLTGATGAGLKIGVLSDGVTSLAVSQSSGDLGAVTVLPGQTGTGDEGTAMLEIIHDLAPGAQLYFATAFTSLTSFAQNIRDLRTAGCDIIVDDVFYFVETPFQDGQTSPTNTNGGAVIQAVKDVSASGALYFSSAGNSGNLNDGTAGVWEGDFNDGGATAAPLPAGGNVHIFTGSQAYDVISVPGNRIDLYWSDPLGGSANDYDVFRLNSTGSSVLGSSTNVQSGTQDPFEEFITHSTSDRIVIVKKTGAAARYLHLNTNRGRLSVATAGQTHGHSATTAPNSFGVAAVNAGSSFPNPFSAANVVETFSSDGPRRIFYDNSGSAFTPGNVSSTGGVLVQKPDIAAADGVLVNGAGGFSSPFFGTSAAAPSAAAVAALIKSANPGFTPTQVRSALIASALDIEAAGVDRDSGAGIVMAQAPQPACTFSLSGSAAFGSAAGSGAAAVGASGATCNWVVWSSVNWITFPSGAVGTNGATVTYSVAANPGPARSGTITVQGGANITITQAANAAAPLTFTNSTPTPIPDNSSAGVNVPVTVSGLAGPIINVTVALYITHTFDSDLQISLVGPDATTVALATGRGSSGDNFGAACSPATSQTTFDSNAATHIVQGTAPYVGTFRSEGGLSLFNGKTGSAANGTWTLRVKDVEAIDVGTVQCWSVNIWTGSGGGTAIGGDFDGDAKADMALYKSNGDWAILKSSGNFTSSLVKNWGGAGYTAVPGDYDGDGIQDLGLYRESTGDWSILKSSSNFTTTLSVNWGGPGYKPVPGDYDGDGKTDPAVYLPATGQWSALKSSSSYSSVVGAGWGGPDYTPVPGQDFDGDGKSDFVVYRQATGVWSILKSSSNFTAASNISWGGAGYTLVPGDYDGDGKADAGLYDKGTGNWYILLSNANYTTTLNQSWGGAGYVPVPADFDGDHKTDLGIFQSSTGNWYVLKSSTNFTTSLSATGWGSGSDLPLSAAINVGGNDTTRATDWDGDTRAELTVYNTGSGVWSILQSSAGYTTATSVSLGGSGYDPEPGDFDGDGKADAVVYQPTTGNWYVLLSSTNFTTSLNKNVGGVGWAPVPADYDGDGKTDFGVYNVSTGFWYVLKSSTNYTTTLGVSWGGSGYIAQPADFDGDGKADLALYQQSTGNWIVLLSSSNYSTTIAQSAGGSGYLPVAADYDGDGRADFAVYNSTTGLWYGLKSSTGYTTTFAIGWGGTGYLPIRGDYDGDGRTDLAIYQPSSGNWYVLLSASNYTTSFSRSWGGAGYTAVPNYLYP